MKFSPRMPINPSITRRTVLALFAAAGALPTYAQAPAAYLSKPIRLVVPFAPGGPNDVMARILAQRLTTDMGQPVIVENRAGAGGMIGTDVVAKAAPDGYTLGFVSAPFTMVPALQSKMPYDTVQDLVTVAKVAESPMLMMVPSTSPFKTAGELIEFAKKNPGKLNYGTGGIGSTPHLTTELLASDTGAKFSHIPYKGGGESIKALMGSEVDLLIDSITSTAGPMASGRVRALAIGQASRSPKMPDVPTFEEAGIHGFSVTHWVGVVAPAKLPPAVLAGLHGAIEKALKAPEVVAKLDELGARPVAGSPESFQKFVGEELKRWQQVVKSANIQAQ